MNSIEVRVIDCHICRETERGYKYLLLKRSSNQIYPNIWQCVTGKIKLNESAHKAAIRELKEETGLSPINFWTLDHVNYFYESKKNRMNLIPVFGAEVDSSLIKLSLEHTEYKWCTIDEGIKLTLWNKQKEGLKIFHKMLTYEEQKSKILKL